MNKGSALTIIALIIGVGGLGIGITFMIIEGPQGPPGLGRTNGLDGTDGVDGLDGTNGVDGDDGADGIDGTNGTNLVAIWNELSGEGSGFNVTLSDLMLNNSDYLFTSDGGNITYLTQPGRYRFTLNLIISGLVSSDAYIIHLNQKSASVQIFEHIFFHQ